jgi:hypothetical protein
VAYARDDLVGARSLFEEALVRDPADIAARNNHADVLLQLGAVPARTKSRSAGTRARWARQAAVTEPQADRCATVPDAAGCAPNRGDRLRGARR